MLKWNCTRKVFGKSLFVYFQVIFSKRDLRLYTYGNMQMKFLLSTMKILPGKSFWFSARDTQNILPCVQRFFFCNDEMRMSILFYLVVVEKVEHLFFISDICHDLPTRNDLFVYHCFANYFSHVNVSI